MLLKETLRNIAAAQRSELESLELGVERSAAGDIDTGLPFAVIVSGVRRCGKSTLLRQVMSRTSNPLYFNFEDPRATGFEVGDFLKLADVFQEEYGVGGCYFFDEIQNVEGWERFVRMKLDEGGHFLITGSNASLLSGELGAKLTGRHLRRELFPFSYGEFLALAGGSAGADSLGEYLGRGGFPEYLRYGSREILRELFSDIVMRDIVVRHRLRSPRPIMDVALYMASNLGVEFSYNGLARTFGLGSTNTAVDYVSYLEDSYLVFTVPRFDYSLRRQAVNPKKAYMVDGGLADVNSVSFTSNRGRMLENAVFLELRRAGREVYYFRGRGECDFLVRERNAVTEAIQVCSDVTEENRGREVGGLVEALDTFGLGGGTIVTYDQSDEVEASGKLVRLTPAWRWLRGAGNVDGVNP